MAPVNNGRYCDNVHSPCSPYAEDYWTADRIGHVIWGLFGVRYEASGIWRLLQRMGWSSQKPQRQPLERDDEAIRAWKRHVWPRIKKVA